MPSANNAVVPGGWSIGVEVFFYLLIPFIWALRSEKIRVYLLLASVLPSLALTLFIDRFGPFRLENDGFLYYWFPTQFPVFAFGLSYYFYLFKTEGRSVYSRWISTLSLPGVIFFGFSGWLCAENGRWVILTPMLMSVSFLLLVMGRKVWMTSFFVHRATVFLGRISYSVYIFHFAVLDVFRALFFKGVGANSHASYELFVVFPLIVAVASGIAAVSKKFIEDPGIRFGRKLSDQIVGGVGRTGS